MANGTHSDSYFLGTEVNFGHRVEISLVAACIAIVSEATSTAYHYARLRLAVSIINNPSAVLAQFQLGVSTDASCLSDATAAGTVPLTSNNVAAQAALVTDAHIDNAISGQFNTFLVPF